jgi:hypothetical protein
MEIAEQECVRYIVISSHALKSHLDSKIMVLGLIHVLEI